MRSEHDLVFLRAAAIRSATNVTGKAAGAAVATALKFKFRACANLKDDHFEH
jgi:hypothetical protein